MESHVRTLRVILVEDGWVVMMPDGKVIDAKYSNEDGALALCTGIAVTVKPAQVVSHDREGK
jgi:hypothetical protein